MIILNKNGDIIESPDCEMGYIESRDKAVKHTYIIDVEEKGHWETIQEYENGGKDVEWKIDVPEEGHWETRDESGEIVEHYDGIIPEDWPKENAIDDTWQYSVSTEYTPEELSEREKAKKEADKQMKYSQQMNAAMLLFVRSSAKSLTDEEALSVSVLFEEWNPKLHYEKDDKVQYKELLYKCISAHDAQESWTPDTAHSLWVRIRPEGEVLEWEPVQPGVNEAYKKGDKVTHKGKTWISDIDNNVCEPSVYGWTEVV